MVFRAVRNDVLRSKAITLITTLFVAAATMLVALAAVLVVNLAGAIDTMMTRAKTPHFMQMHAGDLDRARLAAFVRQNEDVAEFQVLEFLNLDGSQFVFGGGSLAGSVQDNGLSVQSERFDFLLDLDGNVIHAADGHIYVPITYVQDGTARVGDTVSVAGMPMAIAGPLRDSQMQPLLSSSKRFLVSSNDFAALERFGSVEYLIEFRLHDLAALGAFGTAYVAAGLEANGPTITYPFFRVINGLSDGLMIAVILLISVLVIAIAFSCIRFTLLAKIEDDYREIGVMKAIGMRVSDIKRIYLAKYAAIAAVGSLVGYGLSFFLQEPLLANIRLYMGESEGASLAPVLGLIGVVLVFLAISAFVHAALGRFHRIPAAEAIRFGASQEAPSASRRFRLSANHRLGANTFLGLKDVLVRRKLFSTMLVVLVLTAFIIIMPRSLHNTIASKSFITYMGVGDIDLRIDVQQTDGISAKTAEIAASLERDGAVSRFVVLTTKALEALSSDGSKVRIVVELGDHSVFPLTYSAGRAPTTDHDIALSALSAAELGKKVGDVVPVMVEGQARDLTVSGIYSDVTNGGKTAKAALADDGADTMWSAVGVELSDATLVGEKAREYASRFSFAKVSSMDDFVAQTYGPTISAVGTASFASTGVALIITALITLLFMRMLIAKDRTTIAVLKSIGFTNADIKTQYVVRSVSVLALGVLLGTVLANTLGESLAGAVIAMFGATSFAFVVNPLEAYLIAPALMALSVLLASVFGTLDAGKIQVSESIRE
ncbi:MAG: FtsX-like permease family protein [Gemmatimonadaceae bacterium]|nr:FtsX-like permease family protein [Gemmatimonadaceae bacterium]